MNRILIAGLLFLLFLPVQAAELAGVSIKDKITAENGEILLLNGAGLR